VGGRASGVGVWACAVTHACSISATWELILGCASLGCQVSEAAGVDPGVHMCSAVQCCAVLAFRGS